MYQRSAYLNTTAFGEEVAWSRIQFANRIIEDCLVASRAHSGIGNIEVEAMIKAINALVDAKLDIALGKQPDSSLVEGKG
jgi:hypothetical protein